MFVAEATFSGASKVRTTRVSPSDVAPSSMGPGTTALPGTVGVVDVGSSPVPAIFVMQPQNVMVYVTAGSWGAVVISTWVLSDPNGAASVTLSVAAEPCTLMV